MSTYLKVSLINFDTAVSASGSLGFIGTSFTYTVPANHYFQGQIYYYAGAGTTTVTIGGADFIPATPGATERIYTGIVIGPGDSIVFTNSNSGGYHISGTLFSNASVG